MDLQQAPGPRAAAPRIASRLERPAPGQPAGTQAMRRRQLGTQNLRVCGTIGATARVLGSCNVVSR